jgi:hypothetical protein
LCFAAALLRRQEKTAKKRKTMSASQSTKRAKLSNDNAVEEEEVGTENAPVNDSAGMPIDAAVVADSGDDADDSSEVSTPDEVPVYENFVDDVLRTEPTEPYRLEKYVEEVQNKNCVSTLRVFFFCFVCLFVSDDTHRYIQADADTLVLTAPDWFNSANIATVVPPPLTPEQTAEREERSRAMRRRLCKKEMLDDNGDLNLEYVYVCLCL